MNFKWTYWLWASVRVPSAAFSLTTIIGGLDEYCIKYTLCSALSTAKLFVRVWWFTDLLQMKLPSWFNFTNAAAEPEDSFTGYSSAEVQNSEVGSVSGALYLMYSLSSPTATAFVKLNKDGSLVWSKTVNFKTLLKSLTVDSAEHNVYFIQYSASPPMVVVRLNATDGTLTDAQSQ